MLNQWEIDDSCKAHSKINKKYSRFMAQMTWFSQGMVLFGVRPMSDIIWGNVPPKTHKKGRNEAFSSQTSMI